jgi:FKBP-type peptidyl-prolyl cis-trans isomerase
MKKIIAFLCLSTVLVACGDKNKDGVETLPLTSTKQKVSYLMGAENAKQLLQDPNFPRYKKDQLLEGFKIGLKDPKSFDAACQQSIQSCLGQGQGTFNEQFNMEASLCIGKYLGSMFNSSWTQAKSFKEFEAKYLIYGFQIGLAAGDTLIKDEEKTEIMGAFMNKVNARVMADVNQREGAYFKKVKAISGIQSLPNGIFLETYAKGNGGSPEASYDVKAHYVLLNTNGDTLQSSLKNPQIPVFNLGQVIPGWTVAFPFMKKGGKYKLHVPQNMAYGKDTPDPNTIPAFSTLVFYVELVDFGPAGTVK